jgi:hypothetical protein
MTLVCDLDNRLWPLIPTIMCGKASTTTHAGWFVCLSWLRGRFGFAVMRPRTRS